MSPSSTSNSPTCPSASVLKPSIWMAEKCTNTSSPPSCSMKPYPLASLNHFTFPLITIRLLQSLCYPNPTWTLEKTRRSESCQAGFLRSVQSPIQLAIPQEAADITARFGIRNQLDKAIGIAGPGALEPAAHRNWSGVVGRDRRIHTPEAPEQLGEVRRTKMEVEIGHGDPVGIESDVQAARQEGGRAR